MDPVSLPSLGIWSRWMMRTYLMLTFLLGSIMGWSQSISPYVVLGQGHAESCSCYLLADGKQADTTTVWNRQTLDLSQSFDFLFRIRLGCDGLPPDGISFLLSPVDSPLVKRGNRMGYAGLRNTLAVALDTHPDPGDQDPQQNHLELQWNGNTTHESVDNIRGPSPIGDAAQPVTDCSWHTFRIYWDAVNKRLEVGLDHAVSFKLDTDVVKAFFQGNPWVHWGFGGSAPEHGDSVEFCATLNPDIKIQPDTLICLGTPVQTINNSWGFWKQPQFQWEWGDGSSSQEVVPPNHTYAHTGQYTVHVVLTNPDGCTDTTFHQDVHVWLPPEASFSIISPACEGLALNLKDSSTADPPDSVKNWLWSWPQGSSTDSSADIIPTDPGPMSLTLQVKGKAACWSEPRSATVTVLPAPNLSLLALQPCLGSLTTLSASDNQHMNIQSWDWKFPENSSMEQHGQLITHRFTKSGTQPVDLEAWASNGCSSRDTFQIPIGDPIVHASGDSMVVQGQAFHLHATGAAQYTWSPSDGLNNPFSDQPVGVLWQDRVYMVIGTTDQGCRSMDSIHIHVFDRAEFLVPNAFTPNGDGTNDFFHPWNPGIDRILRFSVFDRWGRLLYQSSQPDRGWDGTSRGQPMPVGTYGWEIQGLDKAGHTYKASGSVVLIR